MAPLERRLDPVDKFEYIALVLYIIGPLLLPTKWSLKLGCSAQSPWSACDKFIRSESAFIVRVYWSRLCQGNFMSSESLASFNFKVSLALSIFPED